MSKYIYIVADYDENNLTHCMYETLDDFVQKYHDEFTLFAELDQYIKGCEEDGEEPEYQSKHMYELITEGSATGEWSDEKFFELIGTLVEGIV